MRNKKTMRVFVMLIAAVIIMCGLPMTAYAYDDSKNEGEIDLSEILTPLVTPEPTPEPTPTPEPQPLTPPGNLTLVDDLSGAQSEDKQFITVITKNGNYFYIVIDRADDKENVHFLNLVDEADLLALMEQETKPTPAQPAPIETTPEPTPESDPIPEPEKNNPMGLLAMVLIIGLVGGGAAYYFKVVKPKQAAKKTVPTELDEFAFDDDEDDYGGMAVYEPERGGDTVADIPDFTTAPDSEPEQGGENDFTFDLGDFERETPESGEKE